MGYLLLLFIAFLFSFAGTYVRLIRPYFDSTIITFFRFLVGVLWLVGLRLAVKKNLRFNKGGITRKILLWALIGGLAKWGAYLLENYGLSHGATYGNIVVQPAQIIAVAFISAAFLKEKLTLSKWAGIFLCITGVLVLSLNGMSITTYLHTGGFLTLLYVLSGFCGGIHFLSQKMLVDDIDSMDGNLLTFLIAGAFALIPVAGPIAKGALNVRPDLLCIFAIIMFGFNTGIGFYLNSYAVKMVPFYIVPVLHSLLVFFALGWSILFFHEKITVHVIAGTVIFVIGIIMIQTGNMRHEPAAAETQSR